MQRQKILGIFGEETFPKLGKGYSTKKRGIAIKKIMHLIEHLGANLVYMIPTEGVCHEMLAIFNMMEIPYILVVPHRDFMHIANPKYKALIHQACMDAKNVIVMDESDEISKKNILMDEAIKFVYDNSNKILSIKSNTKKNSNLLNQVDAICGSASEDSYIQFIYDDDLGD
tara:strand:+ start:89 stop:601 length:513 start_codon:yes stop_codon:yes gene_type:complete